MAFFTDTQNKNCYALTNFWTDLTNNNIGRYNWITPDQYNEWHSSLPGGYTYNGVAYTGDQAAIAEGAADGVFHCIAHAAPELQTSVRDLARETPAFEFGHGGEARDIFPRDVGIDRAVGQRAETFHLRT